MAEIAYYPDTSGSAGTYKTKGAFNITFDDPTAADTVSVFFPVSANETAKIISMTAQLDSGTNAVVTVDIDGTDITDLTSITVNGTKTTTDVDPDLSITDAKKLRVTFDSVSGSPVGTITINYEKTLTAV